MARALEGALVQTVLQNVTNGSWPCESVGKLRRRRMTFSHPSRRAFSREPRPAVAWPKSPANTAVPTLLLRGLRLSIHDIICRQTWRPDGLLEKDLSLFDTCTFSHCQDQTRRNVRSTPQSSPTELSFARSEKCHIRKLRIFTFRMQQFLETLMSLPLEQLVSWPSVMAICSLPTANIQLRASRWRNPSVRPIRAGRMRAPCATRSM